MTSSVPAPNTAYILLPSGAIVEITYRVSLGDMLVAGLLVLLCTWLIGSALWDAVSGVFR